MPKPAFYETRKWRRASRNAVIRAGFKCERCGTSIAGKHSFNVHHKRSLKAHPELAMVSANHQALCLKCHRQIETHAILNVHGCDIRGWPTGAAHPWNTWKPKP